MCRRFNAALAADSRFVDSWRSGAFLPRFVMLLSGYVEGPGSHVVGPGVFSFGVGVASARGRERGFPKAKVASSILAGGATFFFEETTPKRR